MVCLLYGSKAQTIPLMLRHIIRHGNTDCGLYCQACRENECLAALIGLWVAKNSL